MNHRSNKNPFMIGGNAIENGEIYLQSKTAVGKAVIRHDVYNHLANKQDIKEEVERYARAAGN